MEKIAFRISRPYKVFATKSVDALVIPVVGSDMTILPERAPTLALLTNGLLQILDDNKNVIERLFIKGGVADIARNKCTVSTEKVIAFDKISLSKAMIKKEEAIHQEDKDFYQMIIDKLNLMKCK